MLDIQWSFTHSDDAVGSLPAQTLMQQYVAYAKNGGEVEDFALPAGANDAHKIVYTTAQRIGESITFRQQLFTIHPENIDESVRIRGRIARTLTMVAGLPHPKWAS